MNRTTAQVIEINGGQCRDRTYDKLIKSHAPFIKIQPHSKPESVKPSLAGQYVALFLSNYASGLLLTSIWLDFLGGRDG